MEVVRDRADNAIIICSIENIDPMGVHTGDIITVAPALTLTDKEYQRMRSASDRGAARNRRRNRRFQRPVRGRSEDRADGGDRDEPARVALVGAGVEGDRLPDRQGRGAAGGRLHARRDRQRHHRRRDAGELRADDRLCRDQDPALRVREVQGRGSAAVDLDEVGRRSDGDRPQASPRACRRRCAGWRPGCPGSTACASSRMPIRRRSKARWRGRRRTGCWSPPRRFARASRSSGSTRSPASIRGS